MSPANPLRDVRVSQSRWLGGLPPKLFNKDVVGLRNDVHINKTTEFVFLCEWRVFAFLVFALSLNVLNHQILLAQLIGVGVVVEDLVV